MAPDAPAHWRRWCFIGTFATLFMRATGEEASVVDRYKRRARHAKRAMHSAAIHIVQDHGSVYPVWATAATRGGSCHHGHNKPISVLHIDKHDDLELPSLPRGVLEVDCHQPSESNNDFMVAAVACGLVNRLLWVHPRFDCKHCDYRMFEEWNHEHPDTPAHRCEV